MTLKFNTRILSHCKNPEAGLFLFFGSAKRRDTINLTQKTWSIVGDLTKHKNTSNSWLSQTLGMLLGNANKPIRETAAAMTEI